MKDYHGGRGLWDLISAEAVQITGQVQLHRSIRTLSARSGRNRSNRMAKHGLEPSNFWILNQPSPIGSV